MNGRNPKPDKDPLLLVTREPETYRQEEGDQACRHEDHLCSIDSDNPSLQRLWACGSCNAPLVDATLTKDDGSTVQVSKCPNDHGKIKSPLCCGADMACAL